MHDKPPYSVKAKLRLKSTAEGGRKTPVKTGYRPNHVFEYKDGKMISAYMGDIHFDDYEWIEPGEERIVTVQFMAGQPIEKFLTVGRQWWIHEGPGLVAEAEIVEVLT